jgi:hypothetical protein
MEEKGAGRGYTRRVLVAGADLAKGGGARPIVAAARCARERRAGERRGTHAD